MRREEPSEKERIALKCTCVQAVREACAPLYATIVGLRAELAELRDHLSQANDTIARMSRCQTAGELQAYRETREAEKGKIQTFAQGSAAGCGEAWAWHAPDAGDVDA